MNNCMNCATLVTSSSTTIQCDACHGSMHASCVGLSESDVIVTRAKSRCIKVVCNNCNNNLMQFNELKSLIVSIKNDFSTALNSLKIEVNEKLASFKKEINGQLSAQAPTSDFEDIVEELNERQMRKSNILIFGVPEQSEQLDGGARKAADSVETSLIFKTVLPNIDMSDTTVQRLGRFNATASRPRPVKVKFSNESVVHSIIREAKKLRTSDKYKNIRFSFDKTPRQIEAYRRLKVELETRTCAGEKDLRIKYVRGVPKIITALN